MPEVAATKTLTTIPDMADAMADGWKVIFDTFPSVPSLSLVLAHWSLETATGRSCVQNNVGNFKRPKPGPDDLWCQFTAEEFEHGQYVTHTPPDPTCRFAAFATLADGCSYYLHQLSTRWAKAWAFALTGDIAGFAQALHEGGYFTAPAAAYVAGMRSRLPLVEEPAEVALLKRLPEPPPTAPEA